MIEINLLPEELRVSEKSVTGTRIVMFIGVPVLFILMFFWGWLHFVVYKQALEELKEIQKKEKDKKVQAEEVKELDAQVTTMMQKQQTVQKLRNLRSLDWVRKLMDLTAAINNTQGWLTKVDLKLNGANSTLTIGCVVIGQDRNQLVANVDLFLKNIAYIKGNKDAGYNPFWEGFVAHDPGYYYRGLSNVEIVEGWEVTKFVMKLEILPEVARNISVSSR